MVSADPIIERPRAMRVTGDLIISVTYVLNRKYVQTTDVRSEKDALARLPDVTTKNTATFSRSWSHVDTTATITVTTDSLPNRSSHT